MSLILQYAWPLIAALTSGFIIGAVFVNLLSKKIKIIQKVTVSVALIIAIFAGVIGTLGVLEYGNKLAKNIFQRKIRVIKDIDLEKDCYFKEDCGRVRGIIKAGSLGTQTFAKGGATYLVFGAVVDNKYVETAK